MLGSRYRLTPKEGEEIPISLLDIERKKELLWISSKLIPQEMFPPCIKNLISKPLNEVGRHRKAAILAAFLGQAGWDMVEAKHLWKRILEGSSISEKIFKKWFQEMHCPICATIRKESKGYPELGLAGLGFCVTEQMCKEFDSPVKYAAGLRTEEDWNKGTFKTIMILNYARIFSWLTGRESTIELSEKERADLETLAIEFANNKNIEIVYTRIRMNKRFRPKFFLKVMDEPRRHLLSEII
ncbi:MAG: hypothetical protein MUO26_02655 [Methanotrichaceae archaeon]|nr:hypothetical protein [Methanotrichaceae archaeon]